MESEPIFQSIGQALYVAFAMEYTGMAQKGATLVLIEDLMTHRYGSASIERPQTLKLGAMNPTEFRGQCALIRKLVNEDGRLSEQERDCIHARYGYQMTRADAVRHLRDHFESLCNVRNSSALLALVWAIYDTNPKHDWSLRNIGREYGVSKSTLHRDQKMLRELVGGIERVATAKLDVALQAKGLIGDSP